MVLRTNRAFIFRDPFGKYWIADFGGRLRRARRKYAALFNCSVASVKVERMQSENEAREWAMMLQNAVGGIIRTLGSDALQKGGEKCANTNA